MSLYASYCHLSPYKNLSPTSFALRPLVCVFSPLLNWVKDNFPHLSLTAILPPSFLKHWLAVNCTRIYLEPGKEKKNQTLSLCLCFTTTRFNLNCWCGILHKTLLHSVFVIFWQYFNKTYYFWHFIVKIHSNTIKPRVAVL